MEQTTDETRLRKFLVNAKRNTYAGNGQEIILPDGGKRLIYEENGFRYQDTYYEFNSFIGQEIVWSDNNPFWGMNYYGKISSHLIKGKITEEEIYNFLKEALLKVTEKYPFRRPYRFKSGDLRYSTDFLVGISGFIGEEYISHNSIKKKIYRLNYHGGLIVQQNVRQ